MLNGGSEDAVEVEDEIDEYFGNTRPNVEKDVEHQTEMTNVQTKFPEYFSLRNNSDDHRMNEMETDRLPIDETSDVKCFEDSGSRDISTQTNLIIPSDLNIPEGRNVRVKFVFEEVD